MEWLGCEYPVLLFDSPGQASADLAPGGAWGESSQCSLCSGGLCRECEIGDISSSEDGVADSFGPTLPVSSC